MPHASRIYCKLIERHISLAADIETRISFDFGYFDRLFL